MTGTSSRNDRTPPKIENPREHNTKEIKMTHTATSQTSRKDRKVSENTGFPPPSKGLKSGSTKETRKLVVPVVTIYA